MYLRHVFSDGDGDDGDGGGGGDGGGEDTSHGDGCADFVKEELCLGAPEVPIPASTLKLQFIIRCATHLIHMGNYQVSGVNTLKNNDNLSPAIRPRSKHDT